MHMKMRSCSALTRTTCSHNRPQHTACSTQHVESHPHSRLHTPRPERRCPPPMHPRHAGAGGGCSHPPPATRSPHSRTHTATWHATCHYHTQNVPDNHLGGDRGTRRGRDSTSRRSAKSHRPRRRNRRMRRAPHSRRRCRRWCRRRHRSSGVRVRSRWVRRKRRRSTMPGPAQAFSRS